MKVKVGKDSIVISDFNETEVLKIAMKIEVDGERYYKSALALATDERMKRTFKRLAEDEQKHHEIFKGLFEVAMRSEGKDPAGADTEEGMFDYIESGIFGKEAEAKNVKDAVLTGEIVELRSILFYKELLKDTKHEGSKKALEEIIEQEQMHLNILKSWEAAV